jgi:hypothetical protein
MIEGAIELKSCSARFAARSDRAEMICGSDPSA